MADLEDQIAENAAAPRSITEDGMSVSEHSLPDQIAADKYLAVKKAASQPAVGIRFAKFVPPGAG